MLQYSASPQDGAVSLEILQMKAMCSQMAPFCSASQFDCQVFTGIYSCYSQTCAGCTLRTALPTTVPELLSKVAASGLGVVPSIPCRALHNQGKQRAGVTISELHWTFSHTVFCSRRRQLWVCDRKTQFSVICI